VGTEPLAASWQDPSHLQGAHLTQTTCMTLALSVYGSHREQQVHSLYSICNLSTPTAQPTRQTQRVQQSKIPFCCYLNAIFSRSRETRKEVSEGPQPA
jgi:hypothetical protein